eukprot:45175_1
MSLDIVAYSSNIREAIRYSYPNTYTALSKNAKGVLLYLKSKNAISGKMTRSTYTLKNTNSEDNLKAWQDYRKNVVDYLKKKNDDIRLNGARSEIASTIVKKHFNTFPKWPKTGERQSSDVIIDCKGKNTLSEEIIVWTCDGKVSVEDYKPSSNTYQAAFWGAPTIKYIIIKRSGLDQFEKKLKSEDGTFNDEYFKKKVKAGIEWGKKQGINAITFDEEEWSD